jgi:serine/threonine-protein kinase
MRDSQLSAGSEFGGYRIEDVIGRGGMAVVYRSTDLRLGRPVALKVIAPDLAQDKNFRARFERESHLAAAIDHPNVIPVFAAGEDQGLLFIAMRLVEGVDLRQLIQREGRLTPEHAASIVDQVAGALDAAHQGGLIHRDVKPGNVLLDNRDGREHAYLTDFGLTKPRAEREQLTQTGMFIGTLEYVAPEQVKGEEVDARTDVYSLGCVLFESLTGQVPFQGDRHVALLWAHMTEPPPHPSTLVPGLPAAFDAVIDRALAKEPADRYASAGELGRAAVAAARGEEAADAPTWAAPPVQAPAPPVAPVARGAKPSRRWSRPRLPSFDRPTRIARRPDEAVRRIPIDESFAYLHEPLREDGPIPLLGNDEIIEELTDRVAHSSGGSFLVTGFRGVGKTTIVDRVVSRVSAAVAPTTVFAVKLNVARSRTSSELLYEIVRRLYDEVQASGLADSLGVRLQERLSVAYRRTSRSFVEKRGEAIERSGGVGIAVPLSGAPKLDMSRKTAVSLTTESSDLPYSDAEVEQDFEQIIRLFQSDSPETSGERRKLFHRRRPPTAAPKCQLLVVVDELDKLTVRDEGRESIEELFAGLKNLLTIRGAHFLFVAGPDLYERAMSERQRGNSVYDAVFGWQVYVPCVWDSEDALLDSLIDEESVRVLDEVSALRDHLAFWGRGLPRQLVGAVQELVRWDAGHPYLSLEGADLQRVRSSAGLERIIREFIDPRAGEQPGGLELDKWRVGVYYAVEWILRFEVTFTADDVVRLASKASIDCLLALNRDEVDELLEYLAGKGLVRQVSGRLIDHTFYGDEPAAQLAAYEVSEDVDALLYGDSAAGGITPSAFKAAVDSDMANGRYSLLEELDRSGTGRVYRARDNENGGELALKVFDLPNLADSPAMRARFEREADIAASLAHPNIVKTHSTFREADGRLAIVMELVRGRSLGHELADVGSLPPDDVMGVALGVLDALDYLHRKGIARLDLRPSSIMMTEARHPKIVNLGLAKPVAFDSPRGATGVGAIVGTPAYAAPEQLEGRPTDIRTDLFALALIMYECLRGVPAREGASVIEVMNVALRGRIDLAALPPSPLLGEVIRRASSLDPDDRYASPSEMRAALTDPPEADSPTRVRSR